MERGYTLLIGTGHLQEKSPAGFLDTYIERKVDGMIIGALSFDRTDSFIRLST